MKRRFSLRRPTVWLVVLVVVLALVAVATPVMAGKPVTVDVQILALNDFHGNLLPPGNFGTTPAGGVEYLATHIDNLRALNRNTVVVSAGDMIGASPLISALFHDEPTIEAFNLIGLDYNAVGNHEFDEGWAELMRMQEGGCHPVDGCLDGDPFDGANFRFLAANVVREDNGKTIFPAYKMRSFAGAKVAFIGMTLEGTPTIVTPSGVAGLDFLDEADTVNALVPELKRHGIETIVVLLHEGGAQNVSSNPGTMNQCSGFTGPVVDIVNRLDDEVDMVISGHTHNAYNCNIDGKLVTSASSFGRVLTKIDMTIDRTTGEVVSMAANNLVVTRDVTPAPLLTALINKYQTLVAPLANRVIGTITADITRTNNGAGESALGDVIADAQLDATNDPGFGDAVAAFMNPGGIRADLVYAQISGGEQPGEVTYGEAFTVQPFGNSLVTMDLTGTQIDTLLEQQFVGCGQTSNRILQVSNGFTYSWSLSAPACSKVDPSTIKINGVTIDPNAIYRVTVNSFLADGGDNFSVLRQGTNRLGGAVDLDALSDYFAAHSPVAPGPQNRITQVP
jgi:5'-nucleotidase